MQNVFLIVTVLLINVFIFETHGFYDSQVIHRYLKKRGTMQQFQSNGQPCPLVVDNAGVNMGTDLGAKAPINFSAGNRAAFNNGPGMSSSLLQPYNPDQQMTPMIPKGEAFNIRDINTYPNTFGPAANLGANGEAGFGANLNVPLGHVIRPAAPFGYPGCDGYRKDSNGNWIPAASQAPPPGTEQAPISQLQPVPQFGSSNTKSVFKPVGDGTASAPSVQTFGTNQGRFSQPFQPQNQFMGPVQGSGQFMGPNQGSQQFSNPIMNSQFLSPPNSDPQKPIDPIQPAVPVIQQRIQPQVPFQGPQVQSVAGLPGAQFATIDQNIARPLAPLNTNLQTINSQVHNVQG